MPEVEVEGYGTADVPEELRLVLAIEEDVGADIMHQCGGNAHCATCRVEFLEGEPEDMTEAEHTLLEMRELLGEARLSCQILVEHDMKVRPVMTMENTGASDPGGKPEEDITPDPMWVERPY